MNNERLIAIVTGLTQGAATIQENATPLTFVVPAAALPSVCSALQSHPEVYADRLVCITGIDNGPESGTMEVLYHLDGITTGLQLALKVIIDRTSPAVPSLCNLWKSADWLERETYDMYGILFTGHPDLRRILLPADWEGHPLRKDHVVQETYHGVTVASVPSTHASGS